MDTYNAVMVCEGVEEAEEEERIRAWQHLIDTGLVWKLQGSFGRMAVSLIEDGVCHENIPCVKCGRRDLPLFPNYQCPECGPN